MPAHDEEEGILARPVQNPFIPAKAGIQDSQALGPRLRGDERTHQNSGKAKTSTAQACPAHRHSSYASIGAQEHTKLRSP